MAAKANENMKRPRRGVMAAKMAASMAAANQRRINGEAACGNENNRSIEIEENEEMAKWRSECVIEAKKHHVKIESAA